jgi:hypothetical protein
VKLTEKLPEQEATVVVRDDTVIVETYSTGHSGPMITMPSTHGALQLSELIVELAVNEMGEEDEVEVSKELQVPSHIVVPVVVVAAVVDEIDVLLDGKLR